jgi:hypothetical protein
MRLQTSHFLLAFAGAILIATPAHAGFYPITMPSASYIARTTLLPITQPDGTPQPSVTDGTETATFSIAPIAGTVPSGGWSTWNSPPYTETATPRVGYYDGANRQTTITITLSVPANTFGMELEPQSFSTQQFTVTFLDGGGNVLGSVVESIGGNAGALVGGASDDSLIASVIITQTDPSGFALAQVRYGLTPLRDPISYEISYASNLLIGDSYVNLTNAGSFNGFDPAGRICANVYVFDPSEELIACCSCLVTPDGLRSLSAKQDLVSNTLTPGVPGSIVIKLVATTPIAGACNPGAPATVGTQIVGGLRAWSTTLHQNTTSGNYQQTENVFQNATLNGTEFQKLTTFCSFIQANGSTFGICRSCRFGGLGGAQQ